MNRIKRVFFVIAAAAVGLFFCCTAKADEKNDYYIVISENAKASEIYAAQVLSEYLSAVSDENYPIIKDSRPFDGYGFYIGNTSAWDTSDILGKTDGSYNLVPFEHGLAIYGAGTRGTLYGVYGFLEDYCGYRCFTAETGMESVTGKITYPENKVEFNSCFEYTDTDWKSPSDAEYSLANGLNGDPHRTLLEEQGGDVDYLGGLFCHTLSTYFCASSRYFNSHPEYFALHGGKRVPYQLCLTNKEVYNIVLSEVMALLRANHDPAAALQIISLTQNDNMYYCECSSCSALDQENASHAGSVITFANKIARAVKQAGYNNVAIDCFAYQYSRKAPVNVVPESNVIVRFCTIESCFSHPLNDAGCPKNVEMLKDIKAWNRLSNRLYVWDYTTNYGYPIGIFPNFGVLQANMQFFHENGIKGVYEEGNYFLTECDSEFGELRSYLISRLLRDPYCDLDREMEMFCNAYYGKGGKYIKEFIYRITECSENKHATIYSSMSESFSISENTAEELDQLWEQAQEASSGDSRASAAVRRSMLSWRYVKAFLGLREFKGSLEDSMDEREDLYNDLISHGVKRIDEWSDIKEDFEPYRYIPIEEWPYADIIHILKFDANGGSGGPQSQWSNGYIIISSDVPVRNGCTFLGWSSDSSAKAPEYLPGKDFTLTGDMTLYAVWEGEEIQEGGESGTETPPAGTETGDNEGGTEIPPAGTETGDDEGGTEIPPAGTETGDDEGGTEVPPAGTETGDNEGGTEIPPAGTETGDDEGGTEVPPAGTETGDDEGGTETPPAGTETGDNEGGTEIPPAGTETGDDEGGTEVPAADPEPGFEYEDEKVLTYYSISVAGTDLNSRTAKDLSVIKGVTLKNGGYARYNPNVRTLYLKDVAIETPYDAVNDTYGLWAAFKDGIPLKISVRGHCSIAGRSVQRGFSMSMAVEGNLTIRLEEGAILDIIGPHAPDVFDNAALYTGENSELVIDGPGTVNIIGGSADTIQGTSYACFLLGNATFKGGCTVNACGGAQAAAGKGLSIQGRRLVFMDSSVVNIQGGNSRQSFGMQFLSYGNHEFITDGWTGRLTIEGRTSAVVGNTEYFTRKLNNTLLYGSESINAEKMRLLWRAVYTCGKLSQYKKLLFGGSDSAIGR